MGGTQAASASTEVSLALDCMLRSNVSILSRYSERFSAAARKTITVWILSADHMSRAAR